jgi:rRNA-processing protein EBP2
VRTKSGADAHVHLLLHRLARAPTSFFSRVCCSYNQALDAVQTAQERFERIGVPHVRPDDYFAEMIKSDKQMTKIKRRMISEQQSLHQAEERRKQQANKKFGKQVQRDTLVARAQKRKREIAEVTQLRKKRKGGANDFDVSVDDAMGGGGARGGGSGKGGGGKGGGGKGVGGGKGAGLSRRDAKEAKFGKKRTDKRNSAESSADALGGRGRGGKGFGGGKGGGGKGGGGKGGGGRGGGGKGGGVTKRPGKDARRKGK